MSSEIFRLAHLSDLHWQALDGVPLRRLLFGKRLTGWVNLRLRRSHQHSSELARAVARDLREAGVDHVVVTGDVTNLALETEFEAVLRMLEEDLALGPDKVTMVPGNHDRYTRGSWRTRRFERVFAAYLQSDVALAPVLSSEFPVVRVRGPLAIVGLSTALPRLPLVAAGTVGQAQLRSLTQILTLPAVRTRTLVVAIHHPPVYPAWVGKRYLEGLRDGRALLRLLASHGRAVVLHGHLHRREIRLLARGGGEITVIGATSASLRHGSDARLAGYNVYEFGPDGALLDAYARKTARAGERFERVPIPRR